MDSATREQSLRGYEHAGFDELESSALPRVRALHRRPPARIVRHGSLSADVLESLAPASQRGVFSAQDKGLQKFLALAHEAGRQARDLAVWCPAVEKAARSFCNP